MISPAIKNNDAVIIERLSVETLRADKSGVMIEQMAELAYQAFREPPWSDDLARPRLHFGLGVDLMRRHAVAYIAKDKPNRIIGYTLGYEIFWRSKDSRELTLSAIAGTPVLDKLFEAGRRVFYIDTLCVNRLFRRRRIAYRLAAAQLDEVRTEGFGYCISRTSVINASMISLFTKLGFQELSVHDVHYPERKYWLLRL
ncbi:MAG: GNAT family N-acetyltransferase [Gammaproteobacteria bacterium]